MDHVNNPKTYELSEKKITLELKMCKTAVLNWANFIF